MNFFFHLVILCKRFLHAYKCFRSPSRIVKGQDNLVGDWSPDDLTETPGQSCHLTAEVRSKCEESLLPNSLLRKKPKQQQRISGTENVLFLNLYEHKGDKSDTKRQNSATLAQKKKKKQNYLNPN